MGKANGENGDEKAKGYDRGGGDGREGNHTGPGNPGEGQSKDATMGRGAADNTRGGGRGEVDTGDEGGGPHGAKDNGTEGKSDRDLGKGAADNGAGGGRQGDSKSGSPAGDGDGVMSGKTADLDGKIDVGGKSAQGPSGTPGEAKIGGPADDDGEGGPGRNGETPEGNREAPGTPGAPGKGAEVAQAGDDDLSGGLEAGLSTASQESSANESNSSSESETETPILIDLDGNGVSITERQRSGVFFDMTGDGYKHRTAWAGVGDGVLAIDADGDGKITERNEIIFTDWDPTARGDMDHCAACARKSVQGLSDEAHAAAMRSTPTATGASTRVIAERGCG